ncbi:hypothetical protein GCM10010350_74050 [Streptomyces galilaeus]|nr:hypothetical protein GCM10010350_74050 [Streptomyces galilaeus]
MLSRLLRQYSENGLLVTMTVGRAAARYRMRTLIGRYPGRRVQLLPTSQDGTAELKVGPHEKIAVVLTGEAGCTPVMALEARTEISRLRSPALKHTSAAIEMRPREAP